MDIEINHKGPDSDHWVKLQRIIGSSSSINLHDHIACGPSSERIFIRSRFQNFDGVTKQWITSIASDETLVIKPISTTTHQKIKFIYFCNCRISSLYPKIVKHHLRDLRQSGVDQNNNFSAIFVVCGTHKDVKIIQRIVHKIIPNICNIPGSEGESKCKPRQNKLEIRLFESSHFEHQGIRTLWNESVSSDDEDILVYAHCKSLSEINQTKEVSHFSKVCSEIILRNLGTIHSLLKTFDSVEKVGISQGGNGWMWHNFFAAKARYLKTRPEPLLMNDRYYYEGWLGGYHFENNFKAPCRSKGLSMLTELGIAIGHLSTPEEINQLINNYGLNPNINKQ